MTENEQNEGFQKCWDLLRNSLTNKQEDFILKLLKSLLSSCLQNSNLFIPVPDNLEDIRNKKEFNCWLLSNLLATAEFIKALEANVDLQINIFQLLASRNLRLFCDLVDVYVNIGNDFIDYLFSNENAIEKNYFEKISSPMDEHRRPVRLSPKKVTEPDRVLEIIVKIFCKLSYQINLHCCNSVEKVWMLTGRCIEAGDTPLKSTSLNTVHGLMQYFNLPNSMQVQSYIIDVIKCCIIAVGEGEFGLNTEEMNHLDKNLCFVVSDMTKSAILPDLHEDVFNSLIEFYQPFDKFLYIPEPLLKEVFKFTQNMLQSQSGSVSLSYLKIYFHKAISQSINLLQVVECPLTELVVADLNKAMPPKNQSASRKRRRSQIEDDVTVLCMSSASSWWGRVQTFLNTILPKMTVNLTMEETHNYLETLSNMMSIGTNITTKLNNPASCSIQILSKEEVHFITKFIVELVTGTSPSECNFELCLKIVFQFSHLACNFNSLIPEECVHELGPTWVSIASLPWLANEVSWLDLQSTSIKLMTDAPFQKSTVNSLSAKKHCVPILSIMLKKVAPLWRCHIIRTLLAENEDSLTLVIIKWLPMISHTLGSCVHPLIIEYIGLALTKYEECLVRLSQSLSTLVCALLGYTRINCSNNIHDEDYLECKICLNESNEQSKSDQIDVRLLEKIFTLATNTSENVVLSFLKSLPNILRHCVITKSMFDTILSLLSCKETKIMQQLAIIFAQILQDSSNEWFIELFARLESLVKGENTTQDSMLKDQMAVVRLLESLIRNKRTTFCEAMLRLLMRLLVSSCANVSCHAHLLVSNMSFALGIHPKEIYIKNRKMCTKVLVETLKTNDVKLVMKHLTEVFHWEESIKNYKEKNVCGSFVSSQISFLLPPLTVRCMKESIPTLLQELASCMDIRLRDMVIDHFQYILSYLVMHCNAEEKVSTLNFISSTTGISIDDIRRCSVQSQVNELVMGLYHHKKAVLKEILILKNLECATKPQKNSNAQKNVVEFLKQRLLGILVFLDFKLSSSSTDRSEKNKVILSLSELLSVMGPMYISSVAVKVLSSLKSFSKLTNPEFEESSCKAWISFLSHLDDHSIENMIEEVLLIINPLAKKFPQAFAPVLKKILLETESISNMMPCLPCLPSCEEFSQINSEIKSRQTYLNGISIENIEITLQIILKGMNHESIIVRCYNLKKLRGIMKENVELFHDLILNTDRVNPIIADINKTLLIQCKENEKDLHALVAECIGLLGAIDPVRICMANRQDERSKLYLTLESADFVYDLIMGLSKAFLSAGDTSIQTCASYAMQELLLLYGIKSNTESNATSLGSEVWKRFSVHTIKILQPLHTSKYRVNTSNPQAPPSDIPSPIYGTKYSKTFHHWLTNWSCSLIELLTTQKQTKVFTVCKPIMRRDTAIAMYLLPYIVICVLTESDANHTCIMTEILAVICEKNSQKSSGEKSNVEVPQELSQLAVQTVFTVLDHVNRYAQKQKDEESSQRRSNVAFTPSPLLQKLFDFMDQIPDDTLAETSFRNQAYSRALSQLEAHMNKNPNNVQSNRMFLQKIYVALDEPDGVTGVASAWQEEPTLQEQIIQYESTGRLHDALSCYEKLCVEDASEGNYQKMLQCYLNLDQPHSVLNITQGLISRKPDLQPTLTEYHIEAAWRLGQWDLIDNYFSNEQVPSSSWGVSVGEVLFAAIKRDSERYSAALQRLRASQIIPISAASMEGSAYQRAYPYIMRLHILAELEEMISGLLSLPFIESNVNRFANIHIDNGEIPEVTIIPTISLADITTRWSKKLDFIQTSSRFLEPVLSFRRTLLKLACDWTSGTDLVLHNELKKQLEQTWLQTAKVARKAGHLQQGERAFISSGHSREVFLERAKWYWLKGEQHQAVATLKKGLSKFYSDIEAFKGNNSPESLDERTACAKTKLLLAQYSEESATLDINVIKVLYREVTEIHKNWEDGQFQLALYYDRILKSMDIKEPQPDWIEFRVFGYGKSLMYGSRYIYQSMPRLLSLWLDFGTKVSQMQKYSNKNIETVQKYTEHLRSLNSYICKISTRLAPYMFLTVLPQLISRICHSNSEVFAILSKLIADTFCSFPQQSMWHLVAVSKSSYNQRAKRCLEIFEMVKEKKPRLIKFIEDATKLADLLIELSNKNLDKGVNSIQMSSILRSLPRLLSQKDFSNILLPLQHFMQVSLPQQDKGSVDISAMYNHNPFPSNQVYIASVDEKVEIMQSLQQPKRIMIRGSDGNMYSMMCKPKDDLRKDCRLMDFNSFVNRLLMRDPDSRKKDLHIRTYTVVPLNEECGLIEWVPNLYGLRPIIYKIYKEMGCALSGRQMKNLAVKKEASLSTKKDIFLTKLMPKHPPVLGNWFLKTFYDPQSWLRARLSYCRTTALMSMVGYILGLGDRHGENILLDSSSGDCVHVDYNCLFNKGETFDWPEKVPFRLTHNMTAAMGPTGIEGFYRKACEATIRVMRQEREALMSVLHPFIYDPLVEWKGSDPDAKTTGEVSNEKAQLHVREIEQRLSGQIKNQAKSFIFPLSVEGQVNFVIQEATNIDNLCQMYIGWAPFM